MEDVVPSNIVTPGDARTGLSRRLKVALVTGSYNYIADGVALTLNRMVGFLASSVHEP